MQRYILGIYLEEQRETGTITKLSESHRVIILTILLNRQEMPFYSPIWASQSTLLVYPFKITYVSIVHYIIVMFWAMYFINWFRGLYVIMVRTKQVMVKASKNRPSAVLVGCSCCIVNDFLSRPSARTSWISFYFTKNTEKNYQTLFQSNWDEPRNWFLGAVCASWRVEHRCPTADAECCFFFYALGYMWSEIDPTYIFLLKDWPQKFITKIPIWEIVW